METKVAVALLMVIVLVIGINGFLILALRKGKDIQQIQLWQKAVNRARDPWQTENKELKELSQLVSKFKKPGDKEEENSNQ
jgi:flagellar biosynthesis chaperone FliJ